MNQLGSYELNKVNDSTFVGQKPLLSILDQFPFAYGGNLVAQSLYAAYKKAEDMYPHSLHLSFCKAIPLDNPLTYNVKVISKSNSFTKVLVEAVDVEGGIVGVTVVSFTTKNNQYERQLEWSKNPNSKNVPYKFSLTPLPMFYQYKPEDIDKFDVVQCYRNLFKIATPPGFNIPNFDINSAAGDRRHGYYMKFNDFNNEEINRLTANDENLKKIYKYVDLGCLSDSNGLALFYRNLNLEFSASHLATRIISLDQSVIFHDDDFDLQQWFYCDANLRVYNNGRCFIVTTAFNLKGTPFMTITQEASVRMNLKVAEVANGGSYKL